MHTPIHKHARTCLDIISLALKCPFINRSWPLFFRRPFPCLCACLCVCVCVCVCVCMCVHVRLSATILQLCACVNVRYMWVCVCGFTAVRNYLFCSDYHPFHSVFLGFQSVWPLRNAPSVSMYLRVYAYVCMCVLEGEFPAHTHDNINWNTFICVSCCSF